MSPLLSALRLLGQRTLREMKSRSVETMSKRFSIALDKCEIRVDALSVAAISSAVSVRMGSLMRSVVASKVENMILNCARRVSAWEAADGRGGVAFVGVVVHGPESEVRTDWLSGMDVITTNEAAGVVMFMDWMLEHASAIRVVAAQSLSLSSVSPHPPTANLSSTREGKLWQQGRQGWRWQTVVSIPR